MATNTVSGHTFAGDKLRGSHTTFLDVSWVNKFMRKVVREKSVKGVRLGVIVPANGNPRRNAVAKEVPVGLEVVVFSCRSKQEIMLWTETPQETARRLGVELK